MKDPFEPLGTVIRGPFDYRWEVPIGVDAYEMAARLNEAFHMGIDSYTPRAVQTYRSNEYDPDYVEYSDYDDEYDEDE